MLNKAIFAIVFLVGAHVATNAMACEIGEYVNNGQCVRCGVSGYYCPDGVNRIACPGYNSATVESWGGCAANVLVRSWALGLGDYSTATQIENCILVVNYNCPQGWRYIETPYADNGTDNPYTVENINWWWSTAKAGYYLTGAIHASGSLYADVAPCTNAPAQAHYTGAGTPDRPDGTIRDATDCPWECDAGYGRHGDECLALCTAGATKLRTGPNAYNIYTDRHTTPAIVVGFGAEQCYVNLELETGAGLNIEYNRAMYHAVD